MRRSILLIAMLLALPATSAAQQTNQPGKTGASSAAPAKKTTKGTPARKGAPAKPGAGKDATAKGAEPAKPPVDPADRIAMLRLRSTFRYAAESCAEGRSRCNRELLQEAEQTFVNACRACDTVDSCEAERQTIRDGKATSSSKLCAP